MSKNEEMQIDTQTTMGEILEAYPSARVGLFQRYHIGGCQSCGYELNETLGGVIQRQNVKDSLDNIVAVIRSSAPAEARLHIAADDLRRALRNGEKIHLIDVRSPEEFAAGHLDGAQLLTVQLTFEMLDAWPKDSPVVTYSNHGRRSLDKASYFTAYGLTNAKSLDGGLAAFQPAAQNGRGE